LGDGRGRLRVVGGQILDRLVGEDDAPAERHARRVALEHLDLVRGVAKLHRNREIQPRRPTADAGDLHENVPGSRRSWQRHARAGARMRTRWGWPRNLANAKLRREARNRIAAAWHSTAPVGQRDVCFGRKAGSSQAHADTTRNAHHHVAQTIETKAVTYVSLVPHENVR